MFFKTIIGQGEIKLRLVELVENNRLSHALLFIGKEGSGGLPLAIAFAQYITCTQVNKRSETYSPSLFDNPGSGNPVRSDQPRLIDSRPNGSSGRVVEQTKGQQSEIISDSCGSCLSCIKAQQLIHPDIHFSYPTIKKTSRADEKPISTNFIVQWRDFIRTSAYGNINDWIEFIKQHPHDKIDNPVNKQGNITAEECNDIIHKLSLKSFESRYKILIMWMPEYLSKLGQGNKLLKIIEEPPEDTLFIFVAENENEILPTIVSRCQLIKCPPLKAKDIELALIERKSTSPELARQVATISEGNYRQALQLVQNTDEDWQSLLREWISSIYRQNLVAQVKWVEEMSRQGREKQKQFLRYFNHLLEQAIRLKLIGDSNFTLHKIEKDFAERLNKIADLSQQHAIIEELDKASYYIERNANAKLLFHALTIKLYHIIHDKIVLLTN